MSCTIFFKNSSETKIYVIINPQSMEAGISVQPDDVERLETSMQKCIIGPFEHEHRRDTSNTLVAVDVIDVTPWFPARKDDGIDGKFNVEFFKPKSGGFLRIIVSGVIDVSGLERGAILIKNKEEVCIEF